MKPGVALLRPDGHHLTHDTAIADSIARPAMGETVAARERVNRVRSGQPEE